MVSITCAILAGGRSSRMGVDKAMLDVGGMTMLARAIELGRQACGRVMVVGREGSPGDGETLYVADRPGPFQGPIGGIVTALEQAGTTVLAMACDVPLLRLETVRGLLEAHRLSPAGTLATIAVVATRDERRAEPLLALYTVEIAPVLKAWIAAGRRSLQPLLETPGVWCWRMPDGMQDELVNVNDQASLANARQRLDQRRGVQDEGANQG